MNPLRVGITALVSLFLLTGPLSAQFRHFITRDGDRLMDGDQQLRFISFNIPNLHYLEDYLPFEGTNPWRLPDEFEIRDALTTIRQMGGKVARMYVLSVRRQDDEPGIIRHVEGPAKFNEEAFRALDKVMQVANDVGIRVIIPFVDNWHWWGGPAEYAAFRAKSRDDFWTDPELLADFKSTIAFLVNRTNTYTGVTYRDDKALLAWETGNELQAPFSWTREIASYIKTLDTNHLLIEGVMAKDLSQEALEDPNLDILSTHHYGDPAVSLDHILSNQALARGKKPYVIGEYGIIPTQEIRALTDTIIRQGLTGGMIWSLRYRNREGGFYHHYEYNRFAAYRWPGFSNGDFYDERMVLSILRDKAYEIDGRLAPRIPPPEPPLLLPIEDISRISWRGCVGASSYDVERREEDSTHWAVVGEGIDESRYQYRPLFNDETAAPRTRYLYRVRARNESGYSEYSNVVGPVETEYLTLADEMESFGSIFQKDGDLRLLTHQDIRKAREDRSRLTGGDGSTVVYKVPGVIRSATVHALRTAELSTVRCAVGSSATGLQDLDADSTVFVFGKNDYGFFDGIAYSLKDVQPEARFFRVTLFADIQICRVEISYSPGKQQEEP